MGTIKRILVGLVVALGLSAPALTPALVSAQNNDATQGGLECGAQLQFEQDAACGAIDTGATSDDVNNVITLAINIISIIVGVVAVIMIVFGGFKYITSNGDSGAVSGAKNTILYAIIGLIVVALAQIIVRFVLTTVSENTTAGDE